MARSQGKHFTPEEFAVIRQGLAEARGPFEVARELKCSIAAIRYWYRRWDGRKWYAHGLTMERRWRDERPLPVVKKARPKIEPNLYRSNFEPT